MIEEEISGTFDQSKELYNFSNMTMGIEKEIEVYLIEDVESMNLLEGRTSDWFQIFNDRIGSLELEFLVDCI